MTGRISCCSAAPV